MTPSASSPVPEPLAQGTLADEDRQRLVHEMQAVQLHLQERTQAQKPGTSGRTA